MESKFNYPEIAPKKLFDLMHRNTYNFYNKAKNFQISQQLLSQRRQLINTLQTLKTQLHFSSQTFFQSIHYLDIIISKNKFKNTNYISLCISCLIISAKFLENDPKIPRLSFLVSSINQMYNCNNFLNLKDLINGEIFALKLLKYKLNYFSVYDFNCFFFDNGIIKMEQVREIFDKKTTVNNLYIKKILEKIYKKSRLLLGMIINSEIFLKYNSLFISIYIMKKSVEYVFENEYKMYRLASKEIRDNNINIFNKNIEKNFIEIMKNFYGINYEISDEYKELVNDIQIQNNNNNKIAINNKIKKIDKMKSFTGERKSYNFNSGTKNDNNRVLRNNLNLNDFPSRNNLNSSINLDMTYLNFSKNNSKFKKEKLVSPIDRKLNFKNYSTITIERGNKYVNEINYYQFITNIVNTTEDKKTQKKNAVNEDTNNKLESMTKILPNKKNSKLISTSLNEYQFQKSKIFQKLIKSNRVPKKISPNNIIQKHNETKSQTFRNNYKFTRKINKKLTLNFQDMSNNNNIINTDNVANKSIGIYSNLKYENSNYDQKYKVNQLKPEKNKTNLNKRYNSCTNDNNFQLSCRKTDIKKKNTEMAFREIFQLQHQIESNIKKIKSFHKQNNSIQNHIKKKDIHYNSNNKKRNKTNNNYLETEQHKKNYLNLLNENNIGFEKN